MSNPNIAQAGYATRFQAGNKVMEGKKRKAPMLYALRYLSRQTIDPHDLSSIDKALPPNPTPVDLMAASVYKKALSGDMRAITFVAKALDDPSVTNAIFEESENYLSNEEKLKVEKLALEYLPDMMAKLWGNASEIQTAPDTQATDLSEPEKINPEKKDGGCGGQI